MQLSLDIGKMYYTEQSLQASICEMCFFVVYCFEHIDKTTIDRWSYLNVWLRTFTLEQLVCECWSFSHVSQFSSLLLVVLIFIN